MDNNNIYYATWGYDMTLNDYVKVLENNGKTAKVVMIGSRIENDNGRGDGRSFPEPSIVKSEPFRLRVRGDNLSGSYPYCGGDNPSKRRDIFFKYEGNGNYYNTWD